MSFFLQYNYNYGDVYDYNYGEGKITTDTPPTEAAKTEVTLYHTTLFITGPRKL